MACAPKTVPGSNQFLGLKTYKIQICSSGQTEICCSEKYRAMPEQTLTLGNNTWFYYT